MKTQWSVTIINSSMEQQSRKAQSEYSKNRETSANINRNSDVRSDKVTLSEEGLSASMERVAKSRRNNAMPSRAETVQNMGKKKAMRVIIKAFNQDKKIDESISRREEKISRLWDDIKNGIGDAEKLKQEIIEENKAIKDTMKWRMENPIIGDALASAEEVLAKVSEEVIGVLLDECVAHLENEAKDKAELLKELEEWIKERAEQIEKYKESNDAETADTYLEDVINKVISKESGSSSVDDSKNILSELI